MDEDLQNPAHLAAYLTPRLLSGLHTAVYGCTLARAMLASSLKAQLIELGLCTTLDDGDLGYGQLAVDVLKAAGK